MSKPLLYEQSESGLRGVFSTMSKAKVGFGDTSRSSEQKLLFYVEEVEEDCFGVQPLNADYIPTGGVHYIGKDELLKKFMPEPSVFIDKLQPAMRNLTKTIARAERHYKQGEHYSAEYEFKNALRIDEENIRATFGLGLTYLARGEQGRGDLVFRRLASLRATFEPRHKHLFNEFGIQLRKNQMFSQAMKYYSRAFILSKNDENLLYNMARTLYEKGNMSGALRFLEKSLKLRPTFTEAKVFIKVVKKKLDRK